MAENGLDLQTHEVYTAYGYVPTKSITTLFLVLFSLSTTVHIGQSVSARIWWLLPTIGLCGLLEILGWAARLWSSISPELFTPYQIQITGTILAPTPLMAANFVILGKIIRYLGPAYSRLSPKQYTIVFCICDIVSLIIQAIGGTLASIAAGNNSDPNPGGNIMLAGIAFQMASISIYILCAIEFFARYLNNRPITTTYMGENVLAPTRRLMGTKIRYMSLAIGVTTIFLFVRAVYRTLELTDGWNGKIITTEVYFNVLDGAMVVLAMYTLNLAHPAVLLDHLDAQPVHRVSIKPGTKRPEDNECSTSSIGLAI